jgi:hypothetical protein
MGSTTAATTTTELAKRYIARHAEDTADLRMLLAMVLDLKAPAPRRPYMRKSIYGGPNSQRRPTTENACGTTRGYRQHRYHREPICDGCQAAHRQETRDRRAAVRAGAGAAE